MSNTTIQILRSYVTSEPSSLNDGELAYSFVSNTIFIGDRDSAVKKIGGEYYVNTIESATSTDLPNTIVLRDSNGRINVTVDTIDGGGF